MSDLPDSDSVRRFIDLATCPFETDDELRISASADLARRIEASPQTTEEVLEDAASRLEKADRSGWRKRMLAVVGTVALVCMIVTVGTTAYRFIQFRGFIGMVSPILNMEGSPSFDHVSWNLSPDARLLLFGNASAGNEAERWKPLWERDRSNPAHLQAYAEGCLSGEDEIPQELLEMIFKYGIVLFIPAACWPLAYWVPRIFLKPGQPDLCRVTLHQVLAPVWAGAVIVSCLLFAFHRFEESKWTQRDRLMAPDAEARGFTYIEGVFANQLALETRELVKVIPQL